MMTQSSSKEKRSKKTTKRKPICLEAARRAGDAAGPKDRQTQIVRRPQWAEVPLAIPASAPPAVVSSTIRLLRQPHRRAKSRQLRLQLQLHPNRQLARSGRRHQLRPTASVRRKKSPRQNRKAPFENPPPKKMEAVARKHPRKRRSRLARKNVSQNLRVPLQKAAAVHQKERKPSAAVDHPRDVPLHGSAVADNFRPLPVRPMITGRTMHCAPFSQYERLPQRRDGRNE